MTFSVATAAATNAATVTLAATAAAATAAATVCCYCSRPFLCLCSLNNATAALPHYLQICHPFLALYSFTPSSPLSASPFFSPCMSLAHFCRVILLIAMCTEPKDPDPK